MKMKILNTPNHAELILCDKRIYFTDAELKDGCIVKLRRIERPRIETGAVEIEIKENKVKVGKYEIGLDDCIRFTIKGIKVEISRCV